MASRGRIARADLGRVGEKLWPRPGSFGQMSKRVAPSVPIVIVRGQGRSGSGSLIKFGHRLHVVTNRHVIERGKNGFTLRFLLNDRTGSRGPLDVVVPAEAVELIHRHADLAVLSLGEKARDIDAERLRPLKLDDTVEVEEDVWVVGHPGAGGHAILVEKVGLGRAKGSGLFSKRVPVSICVCDPIFGAHRVAISGTKTPIFRPAQGTAGVFKKEMVVV